MASVFGGVVWREAHRQVEVFGSSDCDGAASAVRGPSSTRVPDTHELACTLYRRELCYVPESAVFKYDATSLPPTNTLTMIDAGSQNISRRVRAAAGTYFAPTRRGHITA